MKMFSSLFGFILVSFCFAATAIAVKLPAKFVLTSVEPTKLAYFAVSPDNQTIAVRGPTYIQLWNIADQSLIKTIPNQRFVPSNLAIIQMEFTSDGKNVIERFYYAPNIVVTNVETGKVVFEKTVSGKQPYNSIYKFSPSGKSLLVFDANLGSAELIDVKTWTTLSVTNIGISPYTAAFYAGFFFLDEKTLLVEYFDESTTNDAEDFKLFKYKIGTNEVSQVFLNTHLSYTIQMSPTKFIARTNIAYYNYDASVFDLTDKSVTKFYQNDFLPPNDSEKPLAASINMLEYNAHNDVLLVGTTNFPEYLPKGLRLVNMTTKKASPSFDFNHLEVIHLFNNDKENYIVGINRGQINPQEGGVQFIKVGE